MTLSLRGEEPLEDSQIADARMNRSGARQDGINGWLRELSGFRG
jgi:hypothetical protein